jgi:hypothetical protein
MNPLTSKSDEKRIRSTELTLAFKAFVILRDFCGFWFGVGSSVLMNEMKFCTTILKDKGRKSDIQYQNAAWK